MTELLTVLEVAERARVTVRRVHVWVNDPRSGLWCGVNLRGQLVLDAAEVDALIAHRDAESASAHSA